MLRLLGGMLSVLCLVSSAPVTRDTACPSSTLFKETIRAVQKLSSKVSSEIVLLHNTMEAGVNAATYLEGFIEALKKCNESVGLRDVIVVNLQEIQAYGESCTGWMSALKQYQCEAECDFFKNLEIFLRFLGHNGNTKKKY